jgi:cell filamentation protein
MTLDRFAHAVAQTLAAERLEGWAPTAEHVAALNALVHERVSFADYFATFRVRHPPPQRPRRRPGLRRAAPYLIPGTTLLRNHFGASSAEMLADLEFVATAGRMALWLGRPVADTDALDVAALHRQLFADVYSWAGAYRTTELRRGDQGFAWVSTIQSGMTRVNDAALSIVDRCAGYDDARLAYELARLYADFNQIHPFREGNGRTGALLLHCVAARCGRSLDLSGVQRTQWYAAAADSMPFRRDGRASHRPFLYLLSGTISRCAQPE